jgi:hypothetical protein
MLPFLHMATVIHIPLHEYLSTSYRPDCEYVDGEVRGRNVGKYEHARVQALLARWFGNHEQDGEFKLLRNSGSVFRRLGCGFRMSRCSRLSPSLM